MAKSLPDMVELISPPSAVKSPDSDVSPRTQDTSKPKDYFSPHRKAHSSDSENPTPAADDRAATASPTSGTNASRRVSIVSPLSLADSFQDESRRTSQSGGSSSDRPPVGSRKSSTVSISFQAPRHPSLPQGKPRKTDNRRLRASSPSPVRFRQHVGFDNLPAGDSTKNNTSSFTLHVKHQGYQPSRRSRTFMVGVDEHAYSDYALVWLLNNMVDDGDQVVCVRVIENPIRPGEKSYQEDARKLLQVIQSKNEQNRAISIILEWAVGKLHSTFQKLLHLHQPSMLVVGTKGRSLGGIQGLMNTRNSFSKYCLQYSPVPVVVVRPDDKRMKKKEKRIHDPNRQSYAAMLAYNDGKHEADSDASSLYEMEKNISPDEEAHRVAAAIGLPAAFDPTIKPYEPNKSRYRRTSPPSAPSPTKAEPTSVSPSRTTQANESGDEDTGEEEDEYEVEVVSGGKQAAEERKRLALEKEQKKRLHAMEVGEAAALLKSGQSGKSKDSDDEDEEDDTQGKNKQ